MEEDIYMSLPGKYAHPQGLVCKLQKSITVSTLPLIGYYIQHL
jgi:hypothetical protein